MMLLYVICIWFQSLESWFYQENLCRVCWGVFLRPENPLHSSFVCNTEFKNVLKNIDHNGREKNTSLLFN